MFASPAVSVFLLALVPGAVIGDGRGETYPPMMPTYQMTSTNQTCEERVCGPYCYGREPIPVGTSPPPTTRPPTKSPTQAPVTPAPTNPPTLNPTLSPTKSPTLIPTVSPTKSPTTSPTTNPTSPPTKSPTSKPTVNPTKPPTSNPTKSPTTNPTPSPTMPPTTNPTKSPTTNPTLSPTKSPTTNPTLSPTKPPTTNPTLSPTKNPTVSPTKAPTKMPSKPPTNAPSISPSFKPSASPSVVPSSAPTDCVDNDIDICIAIDMSGSVCSKGDVIECNNCNKGNSIKGTCIDPGFESNLAKCCNNFVRELNFTNALIEHLDTVTSNKRFSVVAFSTNAIEVSPLNSGDIAKGHVNNMVYAGGWTNTGDAIKYCYETLKRSTNTRAIVVLTDGTATIGEDNTLNTGEEPENIIHQAYAVGQSQNVQDANILVVPVAVNTLDFNITRLEEIASDKNLLVEVESFEALNTDTTLSTISSMVKCNVGINRGNWVTQYYDNFEQGTYGNWTRIGNATHENFNLVQVRNNSVACPYGGTNAWCVRMRNNSIIEDNTSANDHYMQTPQFSVVGSTMVRIQFDYVVQLFDKNEQDHFHVDTQRDNNAWVDHAYTISTHYNNNVTGTMEKWYNTSGASTFRIRFHIDAGGSGVDIAFIDNILVQRFVPGN